MIDGINELRDRVPELRKYVKDKIIEAKDFLTSVGNIFKSKITKTKPR